jgi:hypothetical protein
MAAPTSTATVVPTPTYSARGEAVAGFKRGFWDREGCRPTVCSELYDDCWGTDWCNDWVCQNANVSLSVHLKLRAHILTLS